MKLVRSDTLYRASCLVAATDSGALRRLVTDRKRHRGLLEQLDASSIKSHPLRGELGGPREAPLPRGMGELLLVDTEDVELGPLLVQVHPARTPRRQGGREALRVVCAGAFVPACVARSWARSTCRRWRSASTRSWTR